MTLQLFNNNSVNNKLIQVSDKVFDSGNYFKKCSRLHKQKILKRIHTGQYFNKKPINNLSSLKNASFDTKKTYYVLQKPRNA